MRLKDITIKENATIKFKGDYFFYKDGSFYRVDKDKDAPVLMASRLLDRTLDELNYSESRVFDVFEDLVDRYNVTMTKDELYGRVGCCVFNEYFIRKSHEALSFLVGDIVGPIDLGDVMPRYGCRIEGDEFYMHDAKILNKHKLKSLLEEYYSFLTTGGYEN